MCEVLLDGRASFFAPCKDCHIFNTHYKDQDPLGFMGNECVFQCDNKAYEDLWELGGWLSRMKSGVAYHIAKDFDLYFRLLAERDFDNGIFYFPIEEE